MKNIFYFYMLNEIGGVETFFYYIDKNYFYFYINGIDNIGYNKHYYGYFQTFFFLKLHPEQEKRVKGISGIGSSDTTFYFSNKSFETVIDSPLYYSRFFNVIEV